MLGEEIERDLMQWDLDMQKHGLLVVQEMIIQKDQEIHRLMYVSTRSVGSEGRVRFSLFMNRHR